MAAKLTERKARDAMRHRHNISKEVAVETEATQILRQKFSFKFMKFAMGCGWISRTRVRADWELAKCRGAARERPRSPITMASPSMKQVPIGFHRLDDAWETIAEIIVFHDT